MKRGAIFAFDAMGAAAVVLVLLLVWASAHSLTLSNAGAAAHEEKVLAKVVAAADWLVKEKAHDFSGWEWAAAEKDVSDARALFRLEGLETTLEEYGGGTETAGAVGGNERWCVSRAVIAEGHAAVLRVCGK